MFHVEQPAAVSEPYIHIHAPNGEYFAQLNDCPTCQRARRMLGWHVEWYGVTWTCAGCGDQWSDGERHERPFERGWRQENILYARRHLAALGIPA